MLILYRFFQDDEERVLCADSEVRLFTEGPFDLAGFLRHGQFHAIRLEGLDQTSSFLVLGLFRVRLVL